MGFYLARQLGVSIDEFLAHSLGIVLGRGVAAACGIVAEGDLCGAS